MLVFKASLTFQCQKQFLILLESGDSVYLGRVLDPGELEERLPGRGRGEGLLGVHTNAELHVVQVNVLLARVLGIHLGVLQDIGDIPTDKYVLFIRI